MGGQMDNNNLMLSTPKEENTNTIVELFAGNTKRHRQLPWYFAPAFLLLWLALFYAVVQPLFNHLPKGIRIDEESAKPGQFVAERAHDLLLEIDAMGPRVVGDVANEVTIVEFLLNEIENIRSAMREDLYEMEVDVQRASGSYVIKGMTNVYQGVQNVIVKLSSRNSNSTAQLLLNSHYDSKPGATGAGDDAAMVVVMLEVLRQFAIAEETFLHPIVFLFNGGEEQPMQGSHGFISQHKWAINCKALLNMDSCGAGGRELLFQSGPNHPWLMRYYKQSIKHPYATTFAEEIFQSGIIPSDTDFRIFRDHGPIPGLDMASVYNGFIYHTKFDRWSAVPRDSLQNTGENILSLARSLANAEEMYDTESHSEGHSIFFDFLGLFFVYYKESTGTALNMSFGLGSILLICVSLWRISKVSCEKVNVIAGEFGILFLLAILAFALAFCFPLLMAVLYDAGSRSMTYYTNFWLIIGVFIIPSVIGLVLPMTLYLTLRSMDRISQAFRLQIGLHAYSTLLAILCIVMTILGFRSTYLCMISLFFYVVSLVFNLLTKLHDQGYYWALPVVISQIMPFLYHTYLFHTILVIFVPITGRNGTNMNPDLIIAILSAFGTILALGFAMPLINVFRRPKSIIAGLAVTMFIVCMISVSHVGFPYRAKTNVMTVDSMQVNRRFYEYDGSLSLEDSGYYLHLLDRRRDVPLRETMDLSNVQRVGDTCGDELMCGIPCYRWCSDRNDALWLARNELVELPYPTVLELVNKTILEDGYHVRYDFRLSGPPNMFLFVKPKEGVKIAEWSFDQTMLTSPSTYKPPLQVLITYGSDSSPLEFYFKLTKSNGNFDEPVFEFGVSGHYVGPQVIRDALTTEFLASLPDFAYSMQWPSSYERHIY
ncbi:endoplasmic reticulum metallopeptidase 1-like [Drosophila tropicalis]|uniref:endoplasmic reticulum metallopeptidase 1-like n=1 Tax=Drosophila tropicalis TaxID=46794 RepID=UPI0035AB87B5